MLEILAVVGLLIGVWCGSVLFAWAVNRHNLIETYGEAPFNYRIFGYTFMYEPYLKRLQQQRERI